MKTSNLLINNNYSTESALLISNIYSKIIFFTTDGDIVFNGIKYTKSPKFEDLDEEFLTKLKDYINGDKETT